MIDKVIADLTDKIKNHPLDIKSLEYNSKLTAQVTCIIMGLCGHHNREIIGLVFLSIQLFVTFLCMYYAHF